MAEMYKTKMSNDFFTLKGLETRTGLLSSDWTIAIIKEIIDNALDAIESNIHKQIEIEYINNALNIFDSGIGLEIDNITNIYDFDNYVSDKRHFITASRGKQGNGLKTIIGMCHVKSYPLSWHTSNGIILTADIKLDITNDNDMDIRLKEQGKTIRRGIEIQDIYINRGLLLMIVKQYAACNPDVTFNINYDSIKYTYEAKTESINKTNETSLAFYGYYDFLRLLRVQDQNETYKSFLGKYFGTRIKNQSTIKGRIIDALGNLDEIKQDFRLLQGTLSTKHHTLLKKHFIGFEHKIESEIEIEDNSEKQVFPCLIEFQVEKMKSKEKQTEINCYVNNSITYADGRSIIFDYGNFKIKDTKEINCHSLNTLLRDFTDYVFDFHFISPYLKFNDYGKTEIDISDCIDELVIRLKKAMSKEKRKYDSVKVKSPTKKSLAEKYMTDAFVLASTNGHYSITARQMYYKLRELINRENSTWETDSTYREFTQNWLTTWLDENEEFESKVNFSERGNFYVEGSQVGLGTANVRSFTDNINARPDKFIVYGGLQDDIFIDDKQFNISYKYDKALYIEKTGFDAVFKAEELDKKYNLLIVSGQGFASRAARRLLHKLQEQGLKLYCMHDLDVSGITILKSMQQANDKFEYDLDMIDLGITPNDVSKYKIVPEKIGAVDRMTLEKLSWEYRSFFEGSDSSSRVELNAFSTQQLLELIDNKLNGINTLPTINLSKSLELDNQALREAAFMRVIKDKYEHQLKNINLKCDLSKYDDRLTLPNAIKEIPHIKEDLINQYVKVIRTQMLI